MQERQIFVSPQGKDRWSGRLPEPNAGRTDGPFATIERSRQAVLRMKRRGEATPIRVVLRGGVYVLDEQLVFTAEDSGLPPRTDCWNRVLGPECGVTYAAFPGEKPIISGGRRITGWRETTVNGVRAWVAHIPQVVRGWYFTQLWVNGRRAVRPRLPRQGYFRIEKLLGKQPKADPDSLSHLFKGQDHFRFAPGDLQEWRNVRDIEFVALHFWIESRVPFAHIDAKKREARLKYRPRMRLCDDHTEGGAQYYVENIFEELKEPGEWYLDRLRGDLYYVPRHGESMTESEIYAPWLPQLLALRGDAEADRWVAHLHFEELTFSHTEWVPGEEQYTATPQAACHIPGAVSFQHARNCSITNCEVTHIGSYGIALMDGSRDITIARNRITDLAAGGVKVWHNSPPHGIASPGSGADMMHEGDCRRNIIADNVIADGGYRWRQAVGVLIGMCSGNQVVHNHIHDFDYTGISVGWQWGYAESHGYGNIIEHNHIHDIGRGVLSDMGAIYTLGVAPGTRIRYNLIHDVDSRGYGGWGIYLDEGSSHVLVENNIVYRTKSQGFHQHYGRENMVRNNIFALGRQGGVARGRIEPHDSFEFSHNIVYGESGQPLVGGNWGELAARFESNLYYDTSGKVPRFGGRTWKQWQRLGADRESVIGDPLFRDAARGDFRLGRRSPAPGIGFVPFVVEAGPREPEL